MKREDKKKLLVNRRIIVNHLVDLESVLDYLIAKQIFTPAIRERIVYENCVPRDRTRQMLDFLITRNTLAYQYFLESLVLTNNMHIVDVIEPNYANTETCRQLIEHERIMNSNCQNMAQHRLSIGPCNFSPSPFLNAHESRQTASNLQFPTPCSQPIEDQRQMLPPPAPASNSASRLQSNLTPLSIQRILKLKNNSSSLLFNHQNYAQLTSSSSSSGIFSASSNSSRSSSLSMSPVTSRSRSTSVNAICVRNTAACGMLVANHNAQQQATTSSYRAQPQPHTQHVHTQLFARPPLIQDLRKRSLSPATNLAGSCDDFDQSSPTTSYAAQLPSAYHVDWSHVNNLELDFMVFKMPNIRKHLNPDECYQMERVPRGVCLIINNERFYDMDGKEMPRMKRFGTDMDARRLRNLFEKLHFRVQYHSDLKANEMRLAINCLANDCELNKNTYDCICLIVLSHGTDGYLFGSDCDNKINMDKEILNVFDDVLIGKPKMFIFQACRGEHLNQKGMLTHSSTVGSLATYSPSVTAASASSQSSARTPECKSSNVVALADEEMSRRMRQLKVSSSSSPASIQLMYKKKSNLFSPASASKEPATTSESSNKQSSTPSAAGSAKTKVRSRSHSRSKYTAYLASAASAIRSVISSSSPSSSSHNKVSAAAAAAVAQKLPGTDTHHTPAPEPAPPQTTSATRYSHSNIITSQACNESLMSFIDGRPIKTSLPARSDFFIWYSSVRGFVSHRDTDGSPFIKCLSTVFSRCAYELELIEMVRKVNFLMQQYEKKHFDETNAVSSYFMVPVAEYHLTKLLYFNP